MPFDANRDIRIQVTPDTSGSLTMRTSGLRDRRRSELEMVGIPRSAMQAAGNLINEVADYAVNTAAVRPDQNVALIGESLLLVVRAIAAGDRVLRLIDPDGEPDAPPVVALATQHVRRAEARRGDDEVEAARAELDAAIALCPGVEDAGSAPAFDVAATYNWQNHLAYLALAEIDDDPARYAMALRRSDELALDELGATLDELGRRDDPAALARLAVDIATHNLGAPKRHSGPTPNLAIVASPIWDAIGDDRVGRYLSLVPADLVELYYDGSVATALRRCGPRLAATAVAAVLGSRPRIARLAWRVRPTRKIWRDPSAPLSDDIGPRHPLHGILSIVLADIGRCLRAGASEAEIADHLDGAPTATFLGRLAAFEAWEGERYRDAMAFAP